MPRGQAWNSTRPRRKAQHAAAAVLAPARTSHGPPSSAPRAPGPAEAGARQLRASRLSRRPPARDRQLRPPLTLQVALTRLLPPPGVVLADCWGSAWVSTLRLSPASSQARTLETLGSPDPGHSKNMPLLPGVLVRLQLSSQGHAGLPPAPQPPAQAGRSRGHQLPGFCGAQGSLSVAQGQVSTGLVDSEGL